jgi:methionyl-tRNA synthetase
MSDKPEKFYITTPIYYVNDRPHIGHVYTTTIADIIARYHRLKGDDVFFLTGVDEHAAKVVDAAAQRGLSPQQWADQNAAVFEETFKKLGITNDEFVRTSQDRHKTRVQEHVKKLVESGDAYLGEYEGWYDAGQEEYVGDADAEKAGFKSVINKKPLVRRKEPCYYFRLSKYQGALLELYEKNPNFVQPEARKNEIVNRIKEGLKDIPISRSAAASKGWGITFPDDPGHTIYVWIDALFNYETFVDTDDRRQYWPANVHLIAKDILWFHAAIWPALLTALKIPLPGQVYAHSFWISEGEKMSKTLGNFIDLEKIDHYVATFGLDALRYFLATNGPMGTTDSDFAEAKFVEGYNTDLANTLGNCFSRVSNMIARYFDGIIPAPDPAFTRPLNTKNMQGTFGETGPYVHPLDSLNIAGYVNTAKLNCTNADLDIEAYQPFKLIKDEANRPAVATVLYHCIEALRIASVLLWPVIPFKCEEIWRRIGCSHYTEALANRGRGNLAEWVKWGKLKPGTPLLTGDALFPRYVPPKV